jgi:hypothetical protein
MNCGGACKSAHTKNHSTQNHRRVFHNSGQAFKMINDESRDLAFGSRIFECGPVRNFLGKSSGKKQFKKVHIFYRNFCLVLYFQCAFIQDFGKKTHIQLTTGINFLLGKNVSIFKMNHRVQIPILKKHMHFS